MPQGQSAQAVRQRRTKPPDRELRQRAIAALVFGAVSLFALLWLGSSFKRGVYLLAFSAITGVAACVIGISALVKAHRTRIRRPHGAIGGVVLGAIATALSILLLMTYLLFPGPVSNYVRCLSTATTQSAQSACLNQFYRSARLHP
ncbi:MAG: DUF4190 domain-containing protein [Streptosporangiaceae bacterium]